MSTFFIRTVSIQTRLWKRPWVRSTRRCGQGKALYVGISSYSSRRTAEAATILRDLGTPALIHQPSYSILNRWIEDDKLLDQLEQEGMGCIAFSPLAQGLLTSRCLDGVPADSRASSGSDAWQDGFLREENLAAVQRLNELAVGRGQTPGTDGDRLGTA